jgi:hypothetical protein
VLTKPGKGAFCRTDLENMLRVQAITHLLVGGVTTEVCVQTTLREANDRGFECLLIEDATESYFPEFKQSTLDMVRAQGGIVAATAHSSDILRAIGVPEPSAGPPTAANSAALPVHATPAPSPSSLHARLALPLGLALPRNLFPLHP